MSRLDRLWAGWRSEYIEGVVSEPPADERLFCGLQQLPDDEGLILERTATTFTVMNAYPYTSGHVMVAPLRHEATLVGLSADEAAEVMHAGQRASGAIGTAFRPEGMNL